MASIINASSSGSGGIVQTADASGVLQLQTNGTVALTVGAGGYLGFRDATIGTTALTLRAINNTYTGGALALQDAAGTTKMYLTQIANAMFFGDNTSVDCLVVNQYGLGLGGTAASSGVGIKFPTTQVASSDANTLDDYEEGTFTPTVLIGGTNNTIATATGTYTKIGNVVFFSCRAENVTKAGTGSLTMGNFPFVASSSGNQNRYSQFTVRWTGINSGGVIIALASVGNAAAEFQNFTTTGGYSGPVGDGSISASYSIYGVSGFYYTS